IMELEAAKRRINAFQKRFGEPHLFFAYHAALPLAITPDLLYQIWANFRRDIQGEFIDIPWIAVSDLILSSLCDEVGHELYEMDATVRQELLDQLKANPRFTEKRLKEVACFLLQYVQKDLNSQDSYDREFAQSQSWAAWAYAKPQKSVELLAAAFRRAYRENPRDLMRLSTLTEMIHQPIPTEFDRLLIFARAMGHYRRKKFEEAKAGIAQLPHEGGVVSVSDKIKIPIPRELLPVIKTVEDEEIAKLVQVIENTQDENTRRRAIESLGEIGVGNPEAVTVLVQVIENTQDEYTRREAIASLGKIGVGNPEAIAGLVQVIQNTQNEDTRRRAAESLEKIGVGNPEAVAVLVQVIENTQDEYTR
ncbi:HEAT repeat domain-containing protein, partial [Limnospira indica]|uniref:HEAT repeat domain-containing protein n=1 Tax=Limnospira indica TaxID=147322 RepID=UPI002357F41F